MRRPRKSPSSRLLADSQRLVLFSQALLESGSRLEERAWERNLDALVGRLLRNDHQDVIDAALDRLFDAGSEAAEVLMEALEHASESAAIEFENATYDALLIALPILAWTRFSIPVGPIPADLLESFSARLHALILAPGAKAALAPSLLSLDQLPRDAAQTYALMAKMAQAALQDVPAKPSPRSTDVPQFLADSRFLLAAVVVPAGQPVFSWQDTQPPHDVAMRQAETLMRWRTEMTADIARSLPGCNTELLLPNAYYDACRAAEKAIRPASILAADYYLTQTLNVASSELQANIAAFVEEDSDGRVEEYRIGFSVGQDSDVVYGIVWPLIGNELDGAPLQPAPFENLMPSAPGAESRTPLDEVMALLRRCGITRIRHHDEQFVMEFCDDCGAPLYPDPLGNLVHAEMPEDVPAAPGHFH